MMATASFKFFPMQALTIVKSLVTGSFTSGVYSMGGSSWIVGFGGVGSTGSRVQAAKSTRMAEKAIAAKNLFPVLDLKRLVYISIRNK